MDRKQVFTKSMKNNWNCVLILLCALFLTGNTLYGTRITAEKNGSKINITIDGKFFTAYNFSSDEKHPFFFPVNGPLSGSSVTAMRANPWPNHASLFFGCDQVNGGSYWEDKLERGMITSVNAQIIKEGGDTVIITDECIWHRPGAESPIKDTREFTITSPSPAIYQVDVKIVMAILIDVHIRKTNHSFFAARMDPDLSVANGGTMINAEGLKSEKNTLGVKSPWIDFYGTRGKVTEGLAILQHPSNPWYPAPWFTRDYGFISPTPMYWPEEGKETYFKEGTQLTLRYRVLVHGGTTSEARIAGVFDIYRNEK